MIFSWTNAALVVIWCLGGGDGRREARFLAGEYTTTVKETYTMTTVVPYSCVQVEPTLPVCRSVKSLRGFPTVGGYVVRQTKGPAAHPPTDHPLESHLHRTDPGWLEYLGLSASTVTKVVPEVMTVTARDPNVVVTFSVKGCKPRELPGDVERCEPTTVAVHEILPTSTVGQAVVQTSAAATGGAGAEGGMEEQEDEYNGPVVEATEVMGARGQAVVETKPLQSLK